MRKIRIGVVRGGQSREYHSSLLSGKEVIDHLPKDTFDVFDFFIDRGGFWHLSGKPISKKELHARVDVVFNALLGEYAEDGGLLRDMKDIGIPVTGSTLIPLARAHTKSLAKEIFLREKIKTPVYTIAKKEEDISQKAKEIFTTFPQPCVIKPNRGRIIFNPEPLHSYSGIAEALERIFEIHDTALIEEYIPGDDMSVSLVELFRGENIYATLPIQITQRIVPAEYEHPAFEESFSMVQPQHVDHSIKHAMVEIAQRAFLTLGLSGYGRADFIVGKRGIYLLEVNSLVPLAQNSIFIQSISSVGINKGDLFEHIAKLALAQAHK